MLKYHPTLFRLLHCEIINVVQRFNIRWKWILNWRWDSFLWSVERNQKYFPVKIFWQFSHNFRILACCIIIIFLNHFITSNIIEISNYRKLLENMFLYQVSILVFNMSKYSAARIKWLIMADLNNFWHLMPSCFKCFDLCRDPLGRQHSFVNTIYGDTFLPRKVADPIKKIFVRVPNHKRMARGQLEAGVSVDIFPIKSPKLC